MGRTPAPKGSHKTKRVNGLRRPLADDIDELLQEHPELGISDRNDFVNRACLMMLNTCRHELVLKIMLKAHDEGRTTPFDDLKKILKL